MRGQQFADFPDAFDDSIGKLLVLKMRPHSAYNVLPELLVAPFVNRFITNNREHVRARRYEDQHRIALAGLGHSESLKFFLRNNQRISIQLAALNKNADFAGSL